MITTSILPTYSHRKKALKFFILLSITLNKKQEEKLQNLNVTSCFRLKCHLYHRKACKRYQFFSKCPVQHFKTILVVWVWHAARQDESSPSAEESCSPILLYSQTHPSPSIQDWIGTFFKLSRLYTYWSSSFAFRMKEPTAVIASVKKANRYYYAFRSEIKAGRQHTHYCTVNSRCI